MDADKALTDLVIKLGKRIEALDELRKKYEGEEHYTHWNGMYHGMLYAQKEVVELRDELFKSNNF